MAVDARLLAEIDGDDSGAQAAFDRTDSSIGRMGHSFGRIAGFATAAFAGIVTAAGGLGLSIAAQNEQAQISFETMLGSADKAGAFLKDLQSFAAKTPFEFPELQKAASSLISVGVEAKDVIPIMTTLGNVTSGMGTGSEGVQRATVALQQMSAAGRITGEDLNQLRDAGIPVFDLLAGATGKTKAEVAALAQAGKLGKAELDAMFEALRTGGAGLERFSGLMEKQSMSLTGMISTLKDTLGQGLATAMQGAFQAVKGGLPAVTEAIGGAIGAIGPAIGGLLDGLLPALGPLIRMFGTAVKAISPLFGIVGQLVGALASGLEPVFVEMVPIIGEIAAELGDLVLALVPIIPIAGDVILALLPLLPPLIRLATAVVPSLVAALDALSPVLPIVAGGFLLFKLGGIISSFLSFIPAVLGLAGAFWTLIAPLAPFILAIAAVGAAVYLLWRNWDTVWSAITGALSTAWDFISNHLTLIAAIVLAPIAPLILLLANWQEVWAAISGAVSAAAGWVGDRISDIVGFFAGLPGRVWDAASGFIGDMARLGAEAMSNLREAIASGAGEVVGLVASLPGRAAGALGDLSGVLWNAGVSLIRGFIGGIGSMFGAVRDTLGDLAGRLFSWKGPPEKDAVLLHKAGELVIGGFVRGIRDSFGDVRGALGDLTDMTSGVGGRPSPALPLKPVLPAVAGLRGSGMGGSASGGDTTVVNLYVGNSVGSKEALVDFIEGSLNTRGQRATGRRRPLYGNW